MLRYRTVLLAQTGICSGIHPMALRSTAGYISLNGQFCEMYCASFKLIQYLLAKVCARDEMQELAGIYSFV